MNIVDHLTLDALRECWGLKIETLECVDKEEGRCCYKASSERGLFFVKTQEDKEEFLEDLERGVRVQVYLEKEGFPTNGVFPTTNGRLLQQWHGYGIVVEPWLERQDFEKNSEHWRIFGQLVGRLHSLPVPDEVQSCISKMDPARNLRTVLEQVNDRRQLVPERYRAQLESFCELVKGLDELLSVPRTLIHSDLAWSNVIRRADGCFMLVDFEGGGIGPPVVDLVEVTTYLCRGPGASGSLLEDAAKAFYKGYRAYRQLNATEISAFGSAHTYHQLYYLANSLGRKDFDFIRRMSARLDNWNGGILDQLIKIATD